MAFAAAGTYGFFSASSMGNLVQLAMVGGSVS